MSIRSPEPQDVERFYTRQRREILQRLAPARSQGTAHRVSWMAAAAMLALTALGLVLLPPPESLTELPSGYFLSETSSLPLPAFGTWSEDEMLDDDDPDMGSMHWLLEDSISLTGTNALPEFLEPFGTWTHLEQSTSVGTT